MRQLNAREEFAHWCGREGFSVGACEDLLCLARKLHVLATNEVNGFHDEALAQRNSALIDKRLVELGAALVATKYHATSSDGWLTVRLSKRGEPSGAIGRGVPR